MLAGCDIDVSLQALVLAWPSYDTNLTAIFPFYDYLDSNICILDQLSSKFQTKNTKMEMHLYFCTCNPTSVCWCSFMGNNIYYLVS